MLFLFEKCYKINVSYENIKEVQNGGISIFISCS